MDCRQLIFNSTRCILQQLRLFFMRHGQTEQFEHPPFNGWRNAPLTPEGRRQLREAAHALKGIPFDAVYSSDLDRAVYGGEQISRAAKVDLSQMPEFREIHFGDWEGLTWGEIQQRWPELSQQIFSSEGSETPFPNGESAVTFQARIKRALAIVLANHPSGRVALMAHSGVCRTIWTLALNLTPSSMWSIFQDYSCLNVIDFYPGGITVARLMNGFLGPSGYYKSGPGWECLKG